MPETLAIPIVTIPDVEGRKRRIRIADIVAVLLEHEITVCGLGLPEIAACRRIYQAKGGPEPITEQSIKKVLG